MIDALGLLETGLGSVTQEMAQNLNNLTHSETWFDTLFPLHLLIHGHARFINIAVTEEGFCSAPSISHDTNSNKQPLYAKVTNPTLSPSHLQDLPGFTRSVYKSDHALITPESHVFSPLPDWSNTLGAYLVSPAMGAHFVMYIAKMQESSKSGLPPKHVERFAFVLQGLVTFTNASGTGQTLTVDSFAYLPPNSEHLFESDESATLVIFERRYSYLEDHIPEPIVGSTDQQALLDTPGEFFIAISGIPTAKATSYIPALRLQHSCLMRFTDERNNDTRYLKISKSSVERIVTYAVEKKLWRIRKKQTEIKLRIPEK
ncbi:ureidoglycine aminohydrolase [Artemisia annua]|uniref:Ureidoglycine aminohydrolase n=1 Tax=Artemisia annua TaxID=35608 RepID=A0A2U1QI28_ARTAN|nr:ureidoglycine aminohydrolase [Artemisia annua]